MRKKIIAGNWKMNNTVSEAVKLVSSLTKKIEKSAPYSTGVIICPPATALASVAPLLKGTPIEMGAQNIFWEEGGAYTGEVSAKMVKNAGAKYTLVAHSERRTYFKESPTVINKKIKLALANKLKVIHCIGETLEEREQKLTKDIVLNQVEWDLKDLTPQDLKNVIIAYEPVWAIGTGKVATPEQAQEVHGFIREILDAIFEPGTGKKMTLLYGGSMKPDNAAGLLAQPDIDGGLIGGACLKADDFMKLIKASEAASK